MQQLLPFTVLKLLKIFILNLFLSPVATALTVYGIETHNVLHNKHNTVFELQQLLPFTVLKHMSMGTLRTKDLKLQQLLPFTVLKLCRKHVWIICHMIIVATALTVYGIET